MVHAAHSSRQQELQLTVATKPWCLETSEFRMPVNTKSCPLQAYLAADEDRLEAQLISLGKDMANMGLQPSKKINSLGLEASLRSNSLEVRSAGMCSTQSCTHVALTEERVCVCRGSY